ncbi:MAG: spore photoproduct lyase family protein [Deferrisomatales bacterium]
MTADTPFRRVEIDPEVAAAPFTRELVARLPASVPVTVRRPGDPPPRGKATVHVTREAGAFLKPCPCSPGNVRCGYRVFTPAFQCPFDCTYCFLRLYAPEAPLTLYANREDGREELARAARSWTGPVRLGTGQFADSLALDPWTGHAPWLLEVVRGLPRVELELKTKSDRVEGLLAVRPPPNAVAAWSVNPPGVIAREEQGTASLPARLGAAARAARAGYRVAFHFDPILVEEGWEGAYRELAGRLFEAVDPGRVAWVSLGTLRFPPRFLEVWGPELRGHRAFFGELLPGEDGKLRTFWPLRRAVYRAVVEALRREGGPGVPVYLCMEPPSMWSAALGWTPAEGGVERYLAEKRVAGS